MCTTNQLTLEQITPFDHRPSNEMDQNFPSLSLEEKCLATVLCNGELAAFIPSPMPFLPSALANKLSLIFVNGLG